MDYFKAWSYSVTKDTRLLEQSGVKFNLGKATLLRCALIMSKSQLWKWSTYSLLNSYLPKTRWLFRESEANNCFSIISLVKTCIKLLLLVRKFGENYPNLPKIIQSLQQRSLMFYINYLRNYMYMFVFYTVGKGQMKDSMIFLKFLADLVVIFTQ